MIEILARFRNADEKSLDKFNGGPSSKFEALTYPA